MTAARTGTIGIGSDMTGQDSYVYPDFSGQNRKVYYKTKGECTVGADSVFEVVLVKKATKDEDAVILFGPEAYVADSSQSATVVAIAEAIAAGVTVDKNTEVRTRFFG